MQHTKKMKITCLSHLDGRAGQKQIPINYIQGNVLWCEKGIKKRDKKKKYVKNIACVWKCVHDVYTLGGKRRRLGEQSIAI